MKSTSYLTSSVMNKALLIQALNRTILTALAVSSLFLYIPAALHGQNTSEEIRLMTDAMCARDAGVANTKPESEVAVEPNESNVEVSVNPRRHIKQASVKAPESEELSEEEKALNSAEALIEAEAEADIKNVEEVDNSIQRKMNSIVIPQVTFSGMKLTRVIETLSELSVKHDPERIGVNIVLLLGSDQKNPQVNISLRNMSLDRILNFVTQQVSFSYDIGSDAVTVSPSDIPGRVMTWETKSFPITRATVIRLTGVSSADIQAEALQVFFQSAGINFEVPGTSLAFDGEQLIVAQTPRNLARISAVVSRYQRSQD